MSELIIDVFTLASGIFLLATSMFLVVIFHKYFRGIKTPHFWIFFLSGFYLMMIQDLLGLYIRGVEFLPFFNSGLKLAATVLIFLGTWELYQSVKR